MKCECSSTNNYQVIGLCDIEKFNAIIQAYRDKTWSHFNVSDVITLSKGALPINKIDKVYVKTKVTSSKVFDTVKSYYPSVEGVIVTGKSLHVNGFICGAIIYNTQAPNGNVLSVKYQIPFTSKITIDEFATKESVYCIYPCVEDVSVKVLDSCSFILEASIFIYTHKQRKDGPIPPEEFLQGVFTFFDLNNEFMATVEFDKAQRELLVKSSGIQYGGVGSGLAFNFELHDISGLHKKAGEVISVSDNADRFVRTLDGIDFDYFDIVNITFDDNTKVRLTGFPNDTDTYDMISFRQQSFIISPLGVMPYTLKEIIVVQDVTNDNVIATIEFDILNKKVLVLSSGVALSSTVVNPYFVMTMVLHQATPPHIIVSSILKPNQDASLFRAYYNDLRIEWGDFLRLSLANPNVIKIVNFPNSKDIYIPTGVLENFIVTKNGLVKRIFATPPRPIVHNIITIKSALNEVVASIQMDVNNKKFMVVPTGRVANSASDDNYFEMYCKSFDNKLDNFRVVLKSNEPAYSFAQMLEMPTFRDNDIFVFVYKDKTKITISNFRRQGANYTPGTDIDAFVLDGNGLLDYTLPNRINLKNTNNQKMSTIIFIKTTPKVSLFANSTDAVSSDTIGSHVCYFGVTQYTGSGIIFSYSIFGNETANRFAIQLDKAEVSSGIGSPMRLYVRNINTVSITNFDNQAVYDVQADLNFMYVTPTGLVKKDVSYGKISVDTTNNSPILYISFDRIGSFIFMQIYSTGEVSDLNLFSFEVLNSREQSLIPPIVNSIVKGQPADNVMVSTDISNIAKLVENDVIVLTYGANKNEVTVEDEVSSNVINLNDNSTKLKLSVNGFVVV